MSMTAGVLPSASVAPDAMDSLTAHQARWPERSVVDARGWRWSWREAGHAAGHEAARASNRPLPPLLLLPGAAGTGDVAWKLAEAFGEPRRVITVTYPSGAAPQELAEGLVELLDRLAIERAAIWTSSYAAWWIQDFADRSAARLAGLWLGNGFVDGQAVAALPLFNREWLDATPAPSVRQAWVEATRQRPAGELRALLLRMLERELPADALRARLIEVARARPIHPATPTSLGLPPGALVVAHCADDAVIGAVARQRVQAAWPEATHLLFEDGGHYPHVTHTTSLIPAMQAWLDNSNRSETS